MGKVDDYVLVAIIVVCLILSHFMVEWYEGISVFDEDAMIKNAVKTKKNKEERARNNKDKVEEKARNKEFSSIIVKTITGTKLSTHKKALPIK